MAGNSQRPAFCLASVMQLLRLVAVVLFAGAVLIWGARGAHRGWTKTSVPITKSDEVTGITYQVYEPRYVPGLDFLGLASGGATVLLGVSFLFPNKPGRNSHPPKR